ncbi:putative addiction module killer protein [Robbsia andropogonis]|uniref:type II toxin-antitoxin system RelE/ParE family toxin n=1 Tax=Robbsia andropogonis TaxID=28092 RepID=UPI00209D32BC|nr:type II toxin-antitoxin system RelE/ParE family toxin [Robbsia andropogonis]MCP1116945.1 type II toxin-antitoxin system RelE/ParE family toxin [Robbsia andropogonis]MCP1126376.1 type II toxin-antitoxin system RelE/ParE family toxin [Robbsia andropogonis]
MNTIQASDAFKDWLRKLRDIRGRARIVARIAAARDGHFGDTKPIQDGVYEMRIHFGPGYRVYYTRRGSTVYFLLVGGDKSTQSRDIAAAIGMAKEIRE